MAIRVNQEADSLITGLQYERNSDWSEAQPSSEDENRFIEVNG